MRARALRPPSPTNPGHSKKDRWSRYAHTAALPSARQDLVGPQDHNALAPQDEGLALGECGLNKVREEI